MQSKVSEDVLSFDSLFDLFLRHVVRVRDQPGLVQALKTLPNYTDLPTNIRDYYDYNSKVTLPPAFDSLRALTPTSTLSSQPTIASPQPVAPTFSRMTSGPTISTNQPQFGKENPVQTGVNFIVRLLLSNIVCFSSCHLAVIDSKCEYSNIDQRSELQSCSNQTTARTYQRQDRFHLQ